MDSRLIAKIEAPKTNGKAVIGTAYPISKDLIITARHVVDFPERNRDKPISIIWPDIKAEDGKPYSDTVSQENIVFNGGEKYDVVLIRCTPPQQHISPLLLSERHPLAHEKWESMGFPNVGKNAEGERKKVSPMGEVFPVDIDNPLLDLESKGDAKEKDGWKGISGAPVFRGHTLIAVITHSPMDINERIRAVSIAYLLEHETEFRARTNIDLRANDFAIAIEILQNNPLARSALFNQISQVNNDIKDSPVQLINYLTHLPVPELIRTINDTQKSARDNVVHSVLVLLLRNILPSVFDPCCSEKIRTSKGQSSVNILEIPCATDISAEMLMADADKRPADFKLIPIDISNPDRKQAIPGCYKLALPPESGAVTAEQQLDNIRDDLFNRLGGGHSLENIQIAVDEHLFKKIPRKQQGRSYTGDQRKRLVKNELQRDARNDKPGYYWIWNISNDLVDEVSKANFQLLAKQIKHDYPQITLLSLDTDNFERELEENDLFELLPDTLGE